MTGDGDNVNDADNDRLHETEMEVLCDTLLLWDKVRLALNEGVSEDDVVSESDSEGESVGDVLPLEVPDIVREGESD